MNNITKLIAFYLPQYHPIPENDKWWGKGFTEWTNVVKAKPQFNGHYQPHIPSDLGFYDLRLPETRQAQANLAKKYGISGFCYYHYWFNGKMVLERPFNEVLSSGQPDFPFCLCWANEDWTRTWDGRGQDILLKQNYNEEDDQSHIRWLIKAMSDKRYIRVDGKPIILIYRDSLLPHPQKTIYIWRKEALKQGLGKLFICKVESFVDEHTDPKNDGFDAAVEFQPDWTELNALKRCTGGLGNLGNLLRKSHHPYRKNRIFEYSELVDLMLQKREVPYKRFPCVTPGWDNSARKQNAVIFRNSTPDLYCKWLSAVIERINFKNTENEEKVVFINAWNEWAEGNHLEPCQKWGKKYLEATWEALNHVT